MNTQKNGCYYTASNTFKNVEEIPIVMPVPVDIVPALFRNNPPPHKFPQDFKPEPQTKCNNTGYKTLNQTGINKPN
jgi:hypothetical protein